MDVTQYTPDAICQSMGLFAFIDPSWSPISLRLLLKPSFDPEVCITLTGPCDAARLSVVALAEMYWRQSGPCVLPTWCEQVVVSASIFNATFAYFNEAFVANQQTEGRMVCLDGMPIAACLLTHTSLEQFACSPYRPAVSAFVSSLVRVAWESCQSAGVRNGLATCGLYVGLRLPQEVIPPAPQLYRLAVIGAPDTRTDYFGHL